MRDETPKSKRQRRKENEGCRTDGRTDGTGEGERQYNAVSGSAVRVWPPPWKSTMAVLLFGGDSLFGWWGDIPTQDGPSREKGGDL